MKRRACSMLPITDVSATSKQICAGATPVRSSSSTTNSRKVGSASVCADTLTDRLRPTGMRIAPAVSAASAEPSTQRSISDIRR